MLKNYFKIAWRNLIRAKGYTLINIGGLGIGMAGALLIFTWVYHEKSYDRFFEKSNRIYQLWSQLPVEGTVFSFDLTPEVLAPTLQESFPEIAVATSYMPMGPMAFRFGDKKLNQAIAFIDSSFFSVFDFEFNEGLFSSLFHDPMSVILTESAAKSIFGSTDVIGKTVTLDSEYDLNVVAILKDLPSNTEFQFDVLLPRDLGKIMSRTSDDWDSFEAETYFIPKLHVNEQGLIKKINHFMHPYLDDVDLDLYSLPLSERHLEANFENGKRSGGRIIIVNSFLLVAFLLLVIACINFMNLSTARSEKRAKEVGIRKVTGASRAALIGQFLSEAMLLALISGALALLIIVTLLPYFSQLTGQQIAVPYHKADFWVFYIGFILFTGLLAGGYPAFFLSSLQPVRVLKGVFIAVKSGLSLRKVLVVSQFTIAITLIITTLVIYAQIDHGRNRDAGYDKNRLLYLRLSDLQQRNYPSISHQLLSAGIASSVSKTFAPITDPDAMGNGYIWDGYSGTGTSSMLFISYATESGLLNTTGIKLIAGRDLDINRFPADSSSILVNETAAAAMNMTDPIGKWVERDGKRWHIIGIVKDFILESPFQKIQPLFITGPFERMNTIHIKIAEQVATADALEKIRILFQQFDPAIPFEYHFADDDYARKFSDEQRTANLAILFTVLTILISCLGLFGLVAFTTEQRTKEIGIRKVLGASIGNILSLLSSDFIKLVLIAFVIASPIAYFFMDRWLQGFNYRINIEWSLFLFTAIIAFFIAIFTVSFQAIKAAMANPVDSLRNE